MPRGLPRPFLRRSRTPPRPPPPRQWAGAASVVSGQLAARGQGTVADAVRQAATSAFDHGLSVGCVVAGAVAVAGALLAGALLPAQPPQPPEPEQLIPTADEGKDLVR